MSVYATCIHFGADDHDNGCAVWIPIPSDSPPGVWHMSMGDGRKFRKDLSQRCTCQCGPVYYRGSHVLPTGDDPREGAFGICEIPGYIGDPEADCDPPHPWLRFWSAGSEHDPGIALLDRAQVAEIHDYLGEWLARTQEREQQ